MFSRPLTPESILRTAYRFPQASLAEGLPAFQPKSKPEDWQVFLYEIQIGRAVKAQPLVKTPCNPHRLGRVQDDLGVGLVSGQLYAGIREGFPHPGAS